MAGTAPPINLTDEPDDRLLLAKPNSMNYLKPLPGMTLNNSQVTRHPDPYFRDSTCIDSAHLNGHDRTRGSGLEFKG